MGCNPDALETLLDLVLETIELDDLIICNGGDPNVPPWFIFAYYNTPMNAPPEDGYWEIDVKGETLREALCAVIAHPRFGQ